ncbi:MAG: tRNA glutamyl-Q(34) synthetase GluQRS [Desulfovibrio sp.]|nr:tRNA glutamyl-Q(34) synthetase GluQRS [Desulfovibrio sp.]
MSDRGSTGEPGPPEAPPVVGRLAPSPTGLLHLGNAWAFLLAWLSARSKGGRVLLRMEDLDPLRSRPAFAAAIVEDLHWLGLDWDAGPDDGKVATAPGLGPMAQSRRDHIYAGAMARLESAGLTYPCFCSRKELRQLASAPHAGEEGPATPDPCRSLTPPERQRFLAAGRHAALRLRSPDEAVCFSDMFQGPQAFRPEAFGGDFALRRSDGVVAYQLAVAVDDGLMGVTEVVRGRDLLPSTPRQLLVMRFLGLTPPAYAHIPLLLDSGGERLAKRHASLSLAALRAAGARPEAVVGYLGRLAGINPGGVPVRPRELVGRFSPAALPRGDLRVMEEDMARLMSPNDG